MSRPTFVLWGVGSYPDAIPIKITAGTWRHCTEEAQYGRQYGGWSDLRIAVQGAPYSEGVDPFGAPLDRRPSYMGGAS